MYISGEDLGFHEGMLNQGRNQDQNLMGVRANLKRYFENLRFQAKQATRMGSSYIYMYIHGARYPRNHHRDVQL